MENCIFPHTWVLHTFNKFIIPQAWGNCIVESTPNIQFNWLSATFFSNPFDEIGNVNFSIDANNETVSIYVCDSV